jgi:CHAD domain-containing protein
MVRIAVKKLRYAMELAREMSGSKATARIETLKNTQDLLGRMNDLEVLIARVRGLQGSGQVPDLRLSSDLDILVRRLETECRQLHGQYMASRRQLLAICERAISAAESKRSAGRAA